jgi:hypothetical protein
VAAAPIDSPTQFKDLVFRNKWRYWEKDDGASTIWCCFGGFWYGFGASDSQIAKNPYKKLTPKSHGPSVPSLLS